MMISAAVGMSSVMTALAQPNQPAVPVGLLCMVQSWTWWNEADAAIRPTASTMSTSSPSVARCTREGLSLLVIAGASFRDRVDVDVAGGCGGGDGRQGAVGAHRHVAVGVGAGGSGGDPGDGGEVAAQDAQHAAVGVQVDGWVRQ